MIKETRTYWISFEDGFFEIDIMITGYGPLYIDHHVNDSITLGI